MGTNDATCSTANINIANAIYHTHSDCCSNWITSSENMHCDRLARGSWLTDNKSSPSSAPMLQCASLRTSKHRNPFQSTKYTHPLRVNIQRVGTPAAKMMPDGDHGAWILHTRGSCQPAGTTPLPRLNLWDSASVQVPCGI